MNNNNNNIDRNNVKNIKRKDKSMGKIKGIFSELEGNIGHLKRK